MSFDELNQVWKSSANVPPAGQIDAATAALAKKLRKDRRGFLIVMGLGLIWMTTLLVRLVWFMAKGGPFDLGREWGSVIFLLIPVGMLVGFLRYHFKSLRTGSDSTLSLPEVLRASLADNRFARTRAVVISLSLIALAGFFPVIVRQLQSVGKAGAEIEPAMYLLPMLVAAIVATLAFQYRKLLKRKRYLEDALLSACS